jgi:hypothetical protein
MLLTEIAATYQVETQVYGVPSLTANSLINAASIYHEIKENLLQ